MTMTDTEAVRLNIGAGDVPIDGYVSIDRKLGTEAYPLEYEDGSVDEVRASHVLEHFGHAEVGKVVEDWVRVLKPGGILKIAVPDFAYIAEAYSNVTDPQARRLLFAYNMGGQTDENDFHKSTFDEPSLRRLLRHFKLRCIKKWESDVGDCAALPVSLNLQAEKPANVIVPTLAPVMSMPRLGFTGNMFCAQRVLVPRGLDVTIVTGCWWHQCLERTLQKLIDDGAEWICTMDYDTCFTGEQFDELCYLLATNPDVDAVAPWQMKREGGTPLCWFTDENGEPKTKVTFDDLEDELVPSDTAHFGLTLIRVEAIQRMAHPWFHEQPNSDGEWGEHRVDPDIYFWHKFKEAGNKLCMASHVCIGHIEQTVTWPGQDLKPLYQTVQQFCESGPPPEIRQ